MAADSFGNDVEAVGVPVTGHIGFAPFGTAVPTPVAGKALDFVLPVDFKIPGLLTEDGGFEWTMEADGDAITFWQDGFSLPSGLANVELKVKFAQTDETVRSIIRGKTADANGYMTIDGGGTSARYVVFAEEIFKNGVIRRRVAANVGVKSVKEDKSERGKVLGYEVTFSVSRSPELDNQHLGEWLIPLPTTP
ncbi:phage tail tube protein [Paenarthrobacter nitroguajacolicus]|uniref:phage tail tube protein n=1 Tax=Paenarthrobacter nitroguajacolicus TaxID=211146 RepID=UPI000FBB0521